MGEQLQNKKYNRKPFSEKGQNNAQKVKVVIKKELKDEKRTKSRPTSKWPKSNTTSKKNNSKLQVLKLGAKIKEKLKEVAKLTLETDKINQRVKSHILSIHNLLKKIMTQ